MIARSPLVYLVRHAIAEERGPAWPDDRLRPLTRGGRVRMRAAVAGLATLGLRIDLVFTSPLVRAVQTAEILAGGLDPSPSIEELAALSPDEPVAVAGRALGRVLQLQGVKRSPAVAFVGHEPGLGELAAWLMGAQAPVVFKKGAVCCLDITALPPRGRGRLRWHAPPKMLRSLGR